MIPCPSCGEEFFSLYDHADHPADACYESRITILTAERDDFIQRMEGWRTKAKAYENAYLRQDKALREIAYFDPDSEEGRDVLSDIAKKALEDEHDEPGYNAAGERIAFTPIEKVVAILDVVDTDEDYRKEQEEGNQV